jgi:hypothetical protein
VRDHHTVTQKLLIESDLLKKIRHSYEVTVIQMLELTAEFGNKLVNFFRELNEVMSPSAFRTLEQLVQEEKVS